MGSAAVTELAVVPPVIQNGKYSDPARTGRNSAFSKRLPEIQKVADDLQIKGSYMGSRRLSQKQRINSASNSTIGNKKGTYLGPRITAA